MATEKTKTIRIIEDACVITSQLKLEDIKKVQKIRPKALSLYSTDCEGNIEEIFKVAAGNSSSISSYGIVFNKANKNGYATITTLFPEHVKDKKEWILNNYAKLFVMLKEVEKNVKHELTEIAEMFNDIENEIEEE